MPPKVLRTWGTRFDTFISSDASPPGSPQPDSMSKPKEIPNKTTVNGLEDPLKLKDPRMPHDASVFVGSLPPNIEQAELTRLLSEHLAEHAEVKYVKVIRDSKGGVCAFVQCEDAPAAGALIHTLNTAVKPFLGRYLRYEPARAFRTLLVSYRTPMQFVLPQQDDKDAPAGELPHQRKHIALDLPSAMKIWRNRGAKYLSILYNDEARASESSQDEYLSSKGGGLYMSPVSFDAETIHKIALIFGPVEQMTPFIPDQADTYTLQDGSLKGNEDMSDKKRVYPSPHDAPRTSEMDKGCWEVKWGHRDDAVSALMTLRRVPHFTVTWAHQPNYAPLDQRLSSPQVSHFSDSHTLPYAYNIAPQLPKQVLSNAGPLAPPSVAVPGQLVVETKGLDIKPSPPDKNIQSPDDVFSSNAAISPVEAPLKPDTSTQALNSGMRPELTEKDFPPLGPTTVERKIEGGWWSDRMAAKSESDGTEGLPSIGSTSPLATPRVSTVEVPVIKGINATGEATPDDGAQDLDMPPTPDFGMSPNTPKTTSSMMFPHTPNTYAFDIRSPSSKEYRTNNGPPSLHDELSKERELDPTTLFVGGLEIGGAHGWDEARVRDFFSKYGGVLEVKVVFPATGRCAFAFVKFDNTDSPARAVFHEHNRLHDGRPMRVQLRDHNPPRGVTWKYSGRGHGKSPQYGPFRHYADSTGIISQESSTEKSKEEVFSKTRDSSTTDHHTESTPITFPTLLRKTDDNYSGTDSDSIPRSRRHRAGSLGATGHMKTPETTFVDYPRSRGPSPQSSGEQETAGYERHDYADPATPPTPPLSSYASSVSATASSIPFPVPNMAYFQQPQTWLHPYASQLPYATPYVANAPGYTVPTQVPSSFASPSGSESSGPSPGSQAPWSSNGAMYPPFLPYSTFPQPHYLQSQQQSGAHAPLVPTGFVQGEQGLIPVYQPEALDHYLAGSSSHSATAQPQSQNPASWRPYPVATTYPFIPVPPAPGQGAGHGANPNWIPNTTPLVIPSNQPGAQAFRGGHNVSHNRAGQRGQNSNHNASSRRHRQNAYDRNIPNRPPHLRYMAGGMSENEQRLNVDHHVPPAGQPGFSPSQIAFSGVPGVGWNQWSGAR